jgi:hypothetical protein
MLTLPADVQLLVLDYIGLQADLKALCKTSKQCRELALPRLYHSIKLITWDADQFLLKKFSRCIAIGAGAHLRFTRALTFELSQPPPEPECHVTGRCPDIGVEIHPNSHEVIDSFILMVLQMFSSDCLRSFR